MVTQLSEKSRSADKEIARLQSKLASNEGNNLLDQVSEIAGVKVLAEKIEGDAKSLRGTLDQLKNKLGSGVIALAVVNGDKVNLIAGVTNDLTDRFHAGQLVSYLAGQLGGKGGGRPDMAQAGASNVDLLPKAMDTVSAWVSERA